MKPIAGQFYSAVFLLNCLPIFGFNAETFNERLEKHLDDLDYDDNNSIEITQGQQVIRSTLPLASSSRSSEENVAGHLPAVSVTVTAFSETFNLDVKLNRYLFAKDYKEKYFNSTGVFYNDVNLKTSHCYYLGSVRDKQHSTAALSTCERIVGFFAIGNISYHIEPLSNHLSGPHRVYRGRKDAKTFYRCGLDHTSIDSLLNPPRHKRRAKRSNFLWPQDLDKQTKVVELYVANDRTQFLSHGSDLNAVYQRAKNIVNIASSAYQPQSIYLVIVRMEVWNFYDPITVNASDSNATLYAWASYRMDNINPLHYNDHAVLITNHTFENGTIDRAFHERMCTNRRSASFTGDVYPLVTAAGSIMAHEIGHSFGQFHDNDVNPCNCSEPSGQCIMFWQTNPASPSLSWSQCSKDKFNFEFQQRGLDICLYNTPETTDPNSFCGNGIVETGEQCDCGNATTQQCNSSCCNPTTCLLIAPATCAYGRCCNIATCQILPCDSVCRRKTNDCDLTEFCNGLDPLCPTDTYKPDGTNCSATAYCYEGLCKSRGSQCQLIYGSGTPDGVDSCYTSYNEVGQAWGNCGMNWLPNVTYIACNSSNVMCGRLQCEASSFQLAYYNQTYAQYQWSIGTRKCYTVVFDYGLKTQDPGLVPNGAACGTDKICVNQVCVDVSSINTTPCSTACELNEVCNNLGRCQSISGTCPQSTTTSASTTTFLTTTATRLTITTGASTTAVSSTTTMAPTTTVQPTSVVSSTTTSAPSTPFTSTLETTILTTVLPATSGQITTIVPTATRQPTTTIAPTTTVKSITTTETTLRPSTPKATSMTPPTSTDKSITTTAATLRPSTPEATSMTPPESTVTPRTVASADTPEPTATITHQPIAVPNATTAPSTRAPPNNNNIIIIILGCVFAFLVFLLFLFLVACCWLGVGSRLSTAATGSIFVRDEPVTMYQPYRDWSLMDRMRYPYQRRIPDGTQL